MKTLILDVESTISNKGNPFDRGNKLCLVGLKNIETGLHSLFDVDYSLEPNGTVLENIKYLLESADILVGFNIKFDLHWIKRYVPDAKFPLVWDCQLCDFIAGNQRSPYPSLDEVCNRLGLGSKLNVVNDQYWSLGIDTPDIPFDTLQEYLKRDLDLTEKLYLYQLPLFKDNKVFRLQCKDLLVLQQMESNGLLYDTTGSTQLGDKLSNEINLLDAALRGVFNDPRINFNSADQLSCCLYGGYCSIPYTMEYQRTRKDGSVSDRTKKAFERIEFKRLVAPVIGSETLPTSKWSVEHLDRVNIEREKEGKLPIYRRYSVDKQILHTIKSRKSTGAKGKEVIELLLRRTLLEKILSTYARGLPKKIQDYNWPEGRIHGQYNQCTTVTGRLASSNPNLQNISGEVKHLFRSRYE